MAISLRRIYSDSVRWLDEATRSLIFTCSIGFLVFVGLATTSEVLFHFYTRQLESETRLATLSFANTLRAYVDRELNTVLFLSSGLASYLTVWHEHLKPREMQELLASIYKDSRHVEYFTVAIGSRVAFVYPEKGNEKIVGVDYRSLPAQWPQIERTIATGKSSLVGPVDLVQGGAGLIYRIPMTVEGKYWGLLSTVFDSASFFQSTFEVARSDRYEFAVRDKDGSGHARGVLWGNPDLFKDPHTTLVEADVPNGTWIYAVRAKANTEGSSIFWFIRALSWLGAILLGLATTLLLRHRVQLAQLAMFDPLTLLPNRRLLDDRFDQLIRRSTRDDSLHCGVIFIDLEDFKAINDSAGHKAGDITLKAVAQRIRAEVRLSDTVARWGGDEFVVITDDTDRMQILQLAERLRRAIGQPIREDEVALQIGASIGIALRPEDGDSAADLLKIADQRMYEDKQKRKATRA